MLRPPHRPSLTMKKNPTSYLPVSLLLGATLSCMGQIVINEVDSDTPGADTAEFVELYNSGPSAQSLDGYVLVFFNGSGDTSYAAYDLDGFSIPAGGYFVVGNSAVPNVAVTFANNFLQNGADAVALYFGNAVDFPNGTAVTATNLVDAIVYDTADADDTGLLTGLGQGAQYDEAEGGDKDNESVARVPNGGTTITTATPTPGAANPTDGGALGISLDTTSISENGSTSITGTVTVGSPVSGSLNVTISVSDVTEATVAFSATISDGETEGIFQIDAVNDLWPDGDQVVTVTASASTYDPAEETITVVDDDLEFALVINEAYNVVSGSSSDVNGDGVANFGDEFVEIVNVSAAPIDLSFYSLRENGFYDSNRPAVHIFPEGTVLAPGAAIVVFSGGNLTPGTTAAFGTAEIQLASDGGLFFTDTGDFVQLMSSSGQEAALITLPNATASNSSTTLATDASYTSGYVLHTSTIPGTIASPGTEIDGSPFVAVSSALELTVNIASIVENSGSAVAAITVALPATVPEPTTIRLYSSDVGELVVPAAVVIPANTLAVNVDLTPVDDSEADGSQVVTVTASSSGYLNAAEAITVEDDGFDTPPFTDLVINEIDPDQTGTDSQEFIELFNKTGSDQSMNGLILVLVNGNGGAVYNAISLDGAVIPANGYFVVGSASVPNVDLAAFNTNGLQNGPDAVVLVSGNIADYTGATVNVNALPGTVIDAVVYGSAGTEANNLLSILLPGGSTILETANGLSATDSISRGADGGAPLDTSLWVVQVATPGLTNVISSPGGYADWADNNGIVGGVDDDDDNDGVSNILEYALGLTPGAPDTLAGSFDGSTLSFTAGAEAVAGGDLTYTIETSADLGASGPWTTVATGLDVNNVISYTLPAGTRLFARLRVTQN